MHYNTYKLFIILSYTRTRSTSYHLNISQYINGSDLFTERKIFIDDDDRTCKTIPDFQYTLLYYNKATGHRGSWVHSDIALSFYGSQRYRNQTVS